MMDIRIDQAARLAREWANLGSMEFVTVEENTQLPDWADPTTSYRWIEFHYIETPARQRFQEITMKNSMSQPNGHKISYSDGQRYSTVEYRQNELTTPQSVFIGTSFDNEATSGSSARPDPLRNYFIDKIPLHEALPTSTYLGSDQFQGKPAHRFLFKDVLWGQMRQELVLHLAEDGILPHQMTFYKNADDRLADRPLWIWSAKTLQTIQGKPIPVKSTSVHYEPSQPGKQTGTTEIEVRKVIFGQTYSDSTFWREADTKTTVFNSVLGTIRPPKNPQPTTQAIVVNPIRIESDTDNSAYLMASGFAIGATALLASLVLWWRRS